MSEVIQIVWTDSLDPDTSALRHAYFPKCLFENELNAISQAGRGFSRDTGCSGLNAELTSGGADVTWLVSVGAWEPQPTCG